MPRGTNAPMVGDYNQSVVLDAVRRAPEGLSQVELITITGLSKQTVSNIVRRLRDDGWFRMHTGAVTGPGKPRTTIRIDAMRLYAVGVHLDPSVVSAVLLDLGGQTLAIRSSVNLLDGDPVASIERIAETVEAMVTEAGIDRALIAGVGIASPGPLDYDRGVLVNPPNLENWGGFTVREAATTAFAYPVLVDKDTLVVATGECWARDHADGASLLFMYLGTGIGCAFAVGGTVVRGQSHNAGEIGHIPADVLGTLCWCGRRGCLGRTSDPHLLVEDAVQLGLLAPSTPTHGFEAVNAGLAALCRLADEGVPAATQLLDRAANAVAEATRMLVGIYDAGLVVFGGPFWPTISGYYLPVVQEHLATTPEGLPSVPRVESTVMGESVGAVGAASLVFDEAFSIRLSAYQLTASSLEAPVG